MPRPGCRWYHLVLSAHGTWLPGDPRGFRVRRHRLHSGGDYKHPPPQGEHAGLYQQSLALSKPATHFPRDIQPILGQTLLDKASEQGHRVLAICVDACHAHVLAELPGARGAVKKTVGLWKQAASHAARHVLPGTIWAKNSNPLAVRDAAHQRQVFRYILAHGRRGAWVWSFRNDSDLNKG